jgi:ferredoxin
MILYFSGTGNSEYVSKRIGKEIDDRIVNLFEKIKNSDFSQMHSERPWIVVTPTYAWRIPRIVYKWLENTNLTGNKEIYFVMTCGENIGNAGKYLEKLCTLKKMNYCGCRGITMPENYIALFATPAQEEALQIIEQAENVIDRTALLIKNGDKFPQSNISLGDRMSSGMVNDIFYPMFVHAKKFYTTEDCISCGKCADVCPLHNIRLENGKPAWGNNCTHCMACICRCPKEAIEYGKHSKGLPRYICPKQA